MLAFQQQDSPLTLCEGLDEYFSAHQTHFDSRDFSAAANEFFRCHDTAHVVFGCDVSLPDEMVVKISSLFGTSIGFAVLQGYALPESKEIYEDLTVSLIVVTALKALVVVPQTIWRCLRMHKRWPWGEFDSYLSVPLSEIRKEFGVVVPH